jgi:hypothetical protein
MILLYDGTVQQQIRIHCDSDTCLTKGSGYFAAECQLDPSIWGLEAFESSLKAVLVH